MKLETRDRYLESLKKVEESLNGFNYDEKELQNLILEIKKQELLVPVIGNFSAGKSSLINEFLGEKSLSVAITPETSIATELRYSTINKIEAYKEEEIFKDININDEDELKSNKYIKMYLNNKRLKDIEPLVLVDMPGFNSPVDLHNDAILNYIEKGSYFIVLISSEEGTISRNLLLELENIKRLRCGFSIVLSKANLRSKEDINLIKQNLKDEVEYLGYDKEIIEARKEGKVVFEEILSSINPDDIFREKFKDRIILFLMTTCDLLDTQIKCIQQTRDVNEREIAKLREEVEKIRKERDKTILELKNGVDEEVEKILSEIENRIYNNTDLIIKDRNGVEIESIIKNVLIKRGVEFNERINFKLREEFYQSSEGKNFKKTFEKYIGSSIDLLLKFKNSNKVNESKKVIKAIKYISKNKENIMLLASGILDSVSYFNDKKNKKNEIINNFIPNMKKSMKDKLKENFVGSINEIVEEKTIIYENEINEKISLIENIMSNNDNVNISEYIEKYNSFKSKMEIELKKI